MSKCSRGRRGQVCSTHDQRPRLHSQLMDTLPTVCATGWASGVNAYATVLLLGIMQRLGVAGVPDGLGRVEVLAIAAVLFTVELVVDKVPYLDSSWDVVHTAIRPTVGTVLGVMIAGDS